MTRYERRYLGEFSAVFKNILACESVSWWGEFDEKIRIKKSHQTIPFSVWVAPAGGYLCLAHCLSLVTCSFLRT